MNETQFEKGKVTVVIPVYNEERYLRETLDSVVSQVDCVIIGDNASTDSTESICHEYVEKYAHIQYFRNEQNIGSIKNIVLCFEKVKTEFFFTMGGHDRIAPNFVEITKNRLQSSDQNVAGVVTSHRWIDNDGNTISIKSSSHDSYFKELVQSFSVEDPFYRVYRYANSFYLLTFSEILDHASEISIL